MAVYFTWEHLRCLGEMSDLRDGHPNRVKFVQLFFFLFDVDELDVSLENLHVFLEVILLFIEVVLVVVAAQDRALLTATFVH